MIRVIIAAADQALGQEIQRSVLETGETEVSSIVSTSAELVTAVLRDDADVALVHEYLGPDPVLSVIGDLSVRRPATAMLLAATSPEADLVAGAMEAGARGLVNLPLTYGQMEGRLTAAAAWSSQMRRALTQGPTGLGFGEDDGRARMVGVAGSKGGVGVTTVVTHLALDVARTVPSLQVCLVDLDLEKGDVPGHIEVRHRLGISDLAKVADDLSPGTVADAMTQHASGVDLLLAPPDIREVEAVTPKSLRLVLAALRRQYDLVLVDLGSHATPAQATALEMTDEIVLVVTPDVASLRGMRRTINAWESLGVCKESDVRVLVNRTSKQLTVSMETVRQLTKAAVVPVGLTASFRRLEPALNSRDPLALRNPQWWTDLRQVGREIGLVPATQESRRKIEGRPAAEPEPSTRRSRRRAGDEGSVTLEALGALPLFIAIATIIWHLAMIGTGAVLQSHAAAAATRAASIGLDPQEAAEDSLPWQFADDVSVDQTWSGDLRVTMQIPGFTVGFPGVPTEVTTTRSVVEEPG